MKDEHKVLSLDQFFEDFSSLIWLTYRKKFETLAKSNLTTDGGWGCMLRSGQMLLANAILIHMLREGLLLLIWSFSESRSVDFDFLEVDHGILQLLRSPHLGPPFSHLPPSIIYFSSFPPLEEFSI